jgi:hypothetical protein
MSTTIRRRLSLVLIFLATLILLSLGGCNLINRSEGEIQEQPTWSEPEDCDGEDKSPRWQSNECGKSPGKGVRIISPKPGTPKATTKR